jgi:hypothetical protein
MGIGSEGYVALEMGRRFVGVELKASYYAQASGIGKREFSLTGIKGQEGEFWADRVTGQLYSPKDGHCLSSPNLRLELGTLKASRVREAA